MTLRSDDDRRARGFKLKYEKLGIRFAILFSISRVLKHLTPEIHKVLQEKHICT